MSFFKLPNWVKPHLYEGKKFWELTEDEKNDIKNRLSKFKNPNPLISIVIPAWNEEENIFKALSSLASNDTDLNAEIIVINNNSTDRTQEILDELGVLNFFEPVQGIAAARDKGLEKAKGKYYLMADSDTYYPPDWINLMVQPMLESEEIKGTYGRYAYVPPAEMGRFIFWIYERITGVLVFIRRKKHEHMNTMGFNMGFVTETGRETGGFNVKKNRVFNNSEESEEYTSESEDGTITLNLKKKGKLQLINHPKSLVFTSPRRLIMDGGIFKAALKRLEIHLNTLSEYITGIKTANSQKYWR